jgi:hypothetical protein
MKKILCPERYHERFPLRMDAGAKIFQYRSDRAQRKVAIDATSVVDDVDGPVVIILMEDYRDFDGPAVFGEVNAKRTGIGLSRSLY